MSLPRVGLEQSFAVIAEKETIRTMLMLTALQYNVPLTLSNHGKAKIER